MTRKEIIQALLQQNLPTDVVSFEEEYPSEKFVIHFNGSDWEVYYAERGKKSGLITFATEAEACAYIFEEILHYAISTKRWRENKKS